MTADDVRYAALALAIDRITKGGIAGAFAELGVYRGETSRLIHMQAPDRRLYLFDSFAGFPADDLEVREDKRFQDTSREAVAKYLGASQQVVFRPGRFPETAAGLEDEQFALVMLDFGLYKPTLAALEFFYPRVVRGGYFFLHDFNSPESDHAISRAASDFLSDKPELLFEIPDIWGTAAFRKI
ncbi:MAG TPA: TylF/MycF/NovP-related O-methyltransferase [Acidobacteriaceae bacterium]|nr:TylF/MycF/NovP-related O-methyltransferase [Acidobacteriaceae bacterium]